MSTPDAQWAERVRALAEEKDAVILAHNYQVPEIQDVAHHVGDSLALSRIAATVPQSTIVFCGVHFMAETDICCTSSNAVEVVASVPADREILFCPDQFLGAHVQRMTGHRMHIWMGECHVHAGINGAELKAMVSAEPDAELFVHPECGCATSAMYLASEGVVPKERTRILSTGGMLEAARTTKSRKVLVATETGMLHQLRKVNASTDFQPVNRAAVCKYMKMITPEKLENALRTGNDVVDVPRDVAERARASVERMIAIGTPSRVGE